MLGEQKSLLPQLGPESLFVRCPALTLSVNAPHVLAQVCIQFQSKTMYILLVLNKETFGNDAINHKAHYNGHLYYVSNFKNFLLGATYRPLKQKTFLFTTYKGLHFQHDICK